MLFKGREKTNKAEKWKVCAASLELGWHKILTIMTNVVRSRPYRMISITIILDCSWLFMTHAHQSFNYNQKKYWLQLRWSPLRSGKSLLITTFITSNRCKAKSSILPNLPSLFFTIFTMIIFSAIGIIQLIIDHQLIDWPIDYPEGDEGGGSWHRIILSPSSSSTRNTYVYNYTCTFLTPDLIWALSHWKWLHSLPSQHLATAPNIKWIAFICMIDIIYSNQMKNITNEISD